MQNALRQNHDVFAWAHSDMKGIDPSITSHRLNVLPTARPIRQRRSGLPGLVSKCSSGTQKEGKWRVCVDYTNLNNACPKDSFPLPRIDQIVDSTAKQGMLSFLDAFSGYHQIPMSPAGRRKNSLHNTTCKTRKEHVLHLQEVFHLLRKYDMKLNPSKCAFGVSAGKFPGIHGQPKRDREWAINAVLFAAPHPRSKNLSTTVSRALADVETRYSKMELTALNSSKPIQHKEPSEEEWWTLRVDGASPIVKIRGRAPPTIPNRRTSGAIHPTGVPCSNNEAEYEVILSGLDLALALSVSKLRVYSDSQLVVRHVQNEYEAKDARMARYLTKKLPLATPLRQNKQTAKSGRAHYRVPPDRHSARRSQTGTQDPGASRPFHPD
ncbi:Transposon Ty3-I Gag-Pol polyprotein [Vitis vinifera]|uniref:Transposon Ty3-I Gag-Pol polyprotein n=1 Tax=Vitis vinifera TaxID=29760 RepID=A0A438ESS2_VITVI|nr:Transposon Ty3-I Gag-Pol polyprotein [Vitis vinifera]